MVGACEQQLFYAAVLPCRQSAAMPHTLVDVWLHHAAQMNVQRRRNQLDEFGHCEIRLMQRRRETFREMWNQRIMFNEHLQPLFLKLLPATVAGLGDTEEDMTEKSW
jgi:hypothetical protein